MAAASALCAVCHHNDHTGGMCPLCGCNGAGTKAFTAAVPAPAPAAAAAAAPASTGAGGGAGVRAPNNPLLHFIAMDAGSVDQVTFGNYFTYAKIMRERVFVTELSLVDARSEMDSYDKYARHVFGMIGDAPVAYARWRVIVEKDMQFALLERILVNKNHRRRTVATRLIAWTLHDITSRLTQLNKSVAAIVVHCPHVEFLGLLFRKFGFVAASNVFVDRSQHCVRMVLTQAAFVKQSPHIRAIFTSAPPLGTATGVINKASLQEQTPAVASASVPAQAPAIAVAVAAAQAMQAGQMSMPPPAAP